MVKKQAEKMVVQAEDRALKTAAQYFAEELLPYFHVEGKVKRVLPTEMVRLEVRQMYQDFNFEMEEGYIAHFEFQSTYEGEEDLRRFREYEATTGRILKMRVVTYVVFSGNIKNPVTSMDTGIGTYQVVPIVLGEDNADKWIGKVKSIFSAGNLPKAEELVPLLLTPLMSGESSQMDRITYGFHALREVEKRYGISEKTQKMQAVLYTLANKFLKTQDLDRVKEMISMTVLGEMLVQDGIQKGMEKGVMALIYTCRELRVPRGDTKDRIMRDCEVTEEKAEEYLKRYWNEA